MQCTLVPVWKVIRYHSWIEGNTHPHKLLGISKDKIGRRGRIQFLQLLWIKASRDVGFEGIGSHPNIEGGGIGATASTTRSSRITIGLAACSYAADQL